MFTPNVKLLERTATDEDTVETSELAKAIQDARTKMALPATKQAERDELQRSITASEARLIEAGKRKLKPENFKPAKSAT